MRCPEVPGGMCWRASAGVRWCPVELPGAPRRGAQVVEKCQPGLGDAQYTRVRGPGCGVVLP